jgi:phosphatidylglycerophosphatase A
MSALRPGATFAFAHPAHALAFGFGAGLAPVAPGTAGTLVAWPAAALLVAALPPTAVLGVVAALFVLGVWCCGVTGRHLGVADHPGMVWDEMVAFLLILAVVPGTVLWQGAAFVLFRFFDIAKPPPIRWLERRHHGGFGVMIDDLLAAGYALLVLALAERLLA